MKKSLKWLVLPLALAIAAEALLLGVADIFGKSTGEMSLNRPSAIWLTWHLPGIMLGFLLFGHDAFAIVVLLLATGILQFFIIFWLMVALTIWIKRGIQWVRSETSPPVLPCFMC